MNYNNYDDNTSENIVSNEHRLNELSKSSEYNCILCNYTSSRKNNYNRHLLSSRHLDNMSKKHHKYICSICNFECVKKSSYNIHLITKKHIQNIKEQEQNTIIKQQDNNKNMLNVDVFKNEIISTLMSQFSNILEENSKSVLAEQTKLMIEQHKMITEIANKPTNSITNNQINNQTNNQQFNMNVFLNETCKDAMNLSEFLENMQVSMEDMEKTGELGFAKGMSRIIMNNLNAIDVCKRPIHCSDVKRETLYVKNNGVWEKETEERKRTKEIIYKVSCLNEKQLIKWRNLPRNKGYEKSDHKKNDEFTKLVMEINKLRDEEIDKVITTVSKHVAIDKDKIKMSGYLN
jgi:hypothetical protein